jgi:hypothetical protein
MVAVVKNKKGAIVERIAPFVFLAPVVSVGWVSGFIAERVLWGL